VANKHNKKERGIKILPIRKTVLPCYGGYGWQAWTWGNQDTIHRIANIEKDNNFSPGEGYPQIARVWARKEPESKE